MKKVGKFEVYDFEEVMDDVLGPVGTPRRDRVEAEAEEHVRAYRIGEAIKLARLEQNLTQEELGERIGVKKSQISRLEHGCDTRLSTAARVFRALGVPPAVLDIAGAGKVALW